MDPALIVGYLASVYSMTSFLPEAWKIIKTGDIIGAAGAMIDSFQDPHFCVATKTATTVAEKLSVVRCFAPARISRQIAS